MTALYPIIRRARRPLIIQDDDSGPAPPPPPVPLVQAEERAPVNYGKRPQSKEKEKDASEAKQRGR